MGCITSREEEQLCTPSPWEYKINGECKAISLEDLTKLRNSKKEGDTEVWKVLQDCCDLVLNDDIGRANEVLTRHSITVVSGDLTMVRDKSGTIYKLEKFCFSTPKNVEQQADLTNDGKMNGNTCNNKFRFRIGTSFLDEEREIIFVFGDLPEGDKLEDDHPKEHSPENHRYYDTYHFTDDVNKITEIEMCNKVLEVIREFPEVKGKYTVNNIRLFYVGRELSKNTPIIRNNIPFDCVIVVLVQCS